MSNVGRIMRIAHKKVLYPLYTAQVQPSVIESLSFDLIHEVSCVAVLTYKILDKNNNVR